MLLRSWADNPKEFANDCAEYLVADQRRLNIGYGSWSGSGEGIGESAISRIALKAISPHCSAELLQQLESRIIGYCDEYEKQTPRWRGSSELLVLRSLDLSRISNLAEFIRKERQRFAALVMKMPDDVDPIYFSAILDGLYSRYVNLALEEKAADEEQISAFSTETFMSVIDRLHELPNRPCGSAIASCIGRLSPRLSWRLCKRMRRDAFPCQPPKWRITDLNR